MTIDAHVTKNCLRWYKNEWNNVRDKTCTSHLPDGLFTSPWALTAIDDLVKQVGPAREPVVRHIVLRLLSRSYHAKLTKETINQFSAALSPNMDVWVSQWQALAGTRDAKKWLAGEAVSPPPR